MKPVIFTICAAAMILGLSGPAAAEDQKRNALRLDAPGLPRMPDTTAPTLFTCSSVQNCHEKAGRYCEKFNYPNGRVLFVEIAETPRPFPIYNVVCFD